MLLREFVVDGHVISLSEEDGLYIAMAVDGDGEKLFYREYDDYDKIKEYFNIIVEEYENSYINIKRVLDILEKEDE